MNINKKALSSFVLGVCLVSLTGCDNSDKNTNEQSQESAVSKSYPNDNIKFSETLPLLEKNVKDPKNMELFSKVTPDEFFAMTFFKSSGLTKDDNFTLKQAVEFSNFSHPKAPIIRENVPYYQSYARSLAAYIFTNSGGYKGNDADNSCLSKELLSAAKSAGSMLAAQEVKSWDVLKNCNALPTGENIKPYEFKDTFVKGSNDSLKYKDLIAQTSQIKTLKEGDSLSGDLGKLGVDEFYALDMASRNNFQPLKENGDVVDLQSSTLGEIIRGFDNKYPGTPVLRGDISFSDSYYRDQPYFSLIKKSKQNDEKNYVQCINNLNETPFFKNADPATILSFKVSFIKQICENNTNNVTQ